MKRILIISTLFILLIMIANLMKIGSLLTALALPFTQNTALSRPNGTEMNAAAPNFYQSK